MLVCSERVSSAQEAGGRGDGHAAMAMSASTMQMMAQAFARESAPPRCPRSGRGGSHRHHRDEGALRRRVPRPETRRRARRGSLSSAARPGRRAPTRATRSVRGATCANMMQPSCSSSSFWRQDERRIIFAHVAPPHRPRLLWALLRSTPAPPATGRQSPCLLFWPRNSPLEEAPPSGQFR